MLSWAPRAHLDRPCQLGIPLYSLSSFPFLTLDSLQECPINTSELELTCLISPCHYSLQEDWSEPCHQSSPLAGQMNLSLSPCLSLTVSLWKPVASDLAPLCTTSFNSQTLFNNMLDTCPVLSPYSDHLELDTYSICHLTALYCKSASGQGTCIVALDHCPNLTC